MRISFSRPSLRTLFVLGVVAVSIPASFAACDSDDTTPLPSVSNDASADGTTTPKTDGSTSTGDSSPPKTDGSTTTDSSTPTEAGADADSDAGTDGSTPIEAGTGVDGGPYGLVYSGKLNGIDERIVDATLAADGHMLAYYAANAEAPFALTVQTADFFSDNFVSIGRWTDGTIGGSFYDDGGIKTLAATDSHHYGLSKVTTNLPASGSANYTLLAATKPRISDGTQAPGTVTAGSAVANFNGPDGTRMGFTLSLQMPDGDYDITFNGGNTPGDAGGGGFDYKDSGVYLFGGSPTVAEDAGVCVSSACSSGVRMVFAGANAERIVVAYVFGPGSLPGARRGVAVFQKQ